jgi:mRNA-degrading endonuclease RelE of RelBE toxin-antitoxin system
VNVTIRITKSFKSAVKPLLKKYSSLSSDLLQLEKELSENPEQGTSLGHNIYKIRLKISSKGKGKSGGARVISLVETVLIGAVQVHEEEVTVNLITIYDKAETANISIYDKAETANISDKELKNLIKTFYKEK